MSSVEERIAVLEFRLAQAEKKIELMEPRPSTASSAMPGNASARCAIASDRDLDGPYGDPIIKKDPKRWTGPSFAGCHMSECSAEYLEEFASLSDWMGDQDDAQGKTWTSKKDGAKPIPASTFKRKDAALARGWAARIRSRGPSQPAARESSSQDPAGNGFADEIPF